MIMRIDFRKIEASSSIGGEVEVFDVSKELGNAIYRSTPDIGEFNFAQELYDDGEVEIDENRAAIVRKYIAANFYAFIQVAVNKRLDEVINP